jgi:hypothetical protein
MVTWVLKKDSFMELVVSGGSDMLFLIRICKCHCCRRARIEFAFNSKDMKESAQKLTSYNRFAIQNRW